MTATKLKRIIALLTFTAALLALNPFNAVSATQSVSMSFAWSHGSGVTFGGSVSYDGSAPSQVGFEYSNTAGWPRTTYIPSRFFQSSTTPQTFTLSTGNLPNGVYTVRAYAQFGGNMVFSDNTLSFIIPGAGPGYPYYPHYPYIPPAPPTAPVPQGRPTVSTVAVSNVSDTSAIIEINVSSGGSARVTSRGVVYSAADTDPALGVGTTVAITGSTGRGSAQIMGLNRSTTYYVRAYATNAHGTSYGEVRTFTTTYDESIVSTGGVLNITPNSATVSGYVYNPHRYTLKERGFVYSEIMALPTINSLRVFENYTFSEHTASFSRELTGLKAGTTYTVRAYIRASSGSVFYGRPVSFTTAATGAVTLPERVPEWNTPSANLPGVPGNEIKIMFKDEKGVDIGMQIVRASQGQVISMTDLMLPPGFKLANPQWQYRVIASAEIAVNLVEGKIEANFMPVGGGFMFRPDDFITRIDVAQVLFNLSNRIIGTNPGVYPDVKNDSRRIAVDFATSHNYITGYADGRFVPEGSVTRADLAIIMCNYYNLVGSPRTVFKDVDRDHWAYHYIALAVEAGLMNVPPDGYIRPGDQVTRAEATVAFSVAESRSLNPITNVGFSDVFEDHWAYKYILNAATPQR